MTTEQLLTSPTGEESISPEAIYQTKESLLAAWSRLPSAHQATMALVLFKDIQDSEWGSWLYQAMELTRPSEPMATEPVFPVIGLSRSTLARAFDAAEMAELTDQDIAQIAEEMGCGFSLDPGFWYTVEMLGRRLLEERDYFPRNLAEPPPGLSDEESFSAWMQAVDRCVWLVSGCSVHDLPDCNFHALFEDGVSPAEMANEALLVAGFEMLE
ncbi:MAG: hypothetical protein KJ069_26090 [Anaerolineae bacterium]|nr:hypothetical protein [Anaerolineae bacterium]